MTVMKNESQLPNTEGNYFGRLVQQRFMSPTSRKVKVPLPNLAGENGLESDREKQ